MSFLTKHSIFFKDSRDMRDISSKSINLVITSPMYPMIEMWDKMFSSQNGEIGRCLERKDGRSAHVLMHKELNKTWEEVDRVLKHSGIICINIGDATRKVGEDFCLFSNHSKIIQFFENAGYYVLPEIIWNKTSNKPNKYMGSGMLPPNAYMTQEHEYILIFRKGGNRVFEESEKKARYKSAYFWEERNIWFSDIYSDISGVRQTLDVKDARGRSGSFPFELPYRLINMFSIQGDTVLDPFLGCYDKETEVLTFNGWKLFKDLTLDDRVASLTDNHYLYYVNPIEIQKYSYNGDMIQTSHRSVDLLVTPNHNMYLKEYHKHNFEFIEAGSIPYKYVQTINSINWNGNELEWLYLSRLQGNYAINCITKEKLKMDYFLQFLGWWISEGCIVNDHFGIHITQTKQQYLQEIGDCITNLGYKWNYIGGKDFRFSNKQLWKYLLENCGRYQPERHIPSGLLNLSSRQLSILFDSLIKGDGCIDKNGFIQFYTSSKILADQMQELAIKIGYNSTLNSRFKKLPTFNGKSILQNYPAFEIHIRKSPYCKINRDNHIRKVKYNGMVYCCTVPTHILCVRRNGKPVWCGNSGTTVFSAMALARNSIGYEIDTPKGQIIDYSMKDMINFVKRYNKKRLEGHKKLLDLKEPKYTSQYGNVMTKQETEIQLYTIRSIQTLDTSFKSYQIEHQELRENEK